MEQSREIESSGWPDEGSSQERRPWSLVRADQSRLGRSDASTDPAGQGEAAGRNKDRTLKGPVGPGKSVSTELRSSNGNARCVCVGLG